MALRRYTCHFLTSNVTTRSIMGPGSVAFLSTCIAMCKSMSVPESQKLRDRVVHSSECVDEESQAGKGSGFAGVPSPPRGPSLITDLLQWTRLFVCRNVLQMRGKVEPLSFITVCLYFAKANYLLTVTAVYRPVKMTALTDVFHLFATKYYYVEEMELISVLCPFSIFIVMDTYSDFRFH